MKKVFINPYYMAIISIIVIVLIVALSLNLNSNSNDAAGQAYLQETGIEYTKRVVEGPGMTKTYTETEPTAYAYLRDN